MMTKRQIQKLLNDYDLEITFTKKDGSVRVMKCTSNIPKKDVVPVPEGESISDYLTKKVRKVSNRPDDVMVVYDIEIGDWRSFYVDSVESVKILNTRFGLLQE
jgi:hypothetical protein